MSCNCRISTCHVSGCTNDKSPIAFLFNTLKLHLCAITFMYLSWLQWAIFLSLHLNKKRCLIEEFMQACYLFVAKQSLNFMFLLSISTILNS